MKTHIHKLATYRNAKTKERAVLYQVFGTTHVGVLIFDFRARYAKHDFVHVNKMDAIAEIKNLGFTVGDQS